ATGGVAWLYLMAAMVLQKLTRVWQSWFARLSSSCNCCRFSGDTSLEARCRSLITVVISASSTCHASVTSPTCLLAACDRAIRLLTWLLSAVRLAAALV